MVFIYLLMLGNRYLPGIKLPENIVACPDLVKTCEDATMLVFVVPHQVGHEHQTQLSDVG
jgi:glycerol-3-phosphate dehydrogenase